MSPADFQERLDNLERRVTALEHRAAMEAQIAELCAQVAELTRRLDQYDTATAAAHAIRPTIPTPSFEESMARLRKLQDQNAASTKSNAGMDKLNRNLEKLRKANRYRRPRT